MGCLFYYMVRGLESGAVYQMRVRVLDRDTGDTSVWSNIITFMTDWDDDRFQLEREADNWLNHIRRVLLELTRQPFWVAVDTPDVLRVVYRPDAFRGMIDSTPGATIALHNTSARTSIYYLPVSGILEANEHRKGFSTSYADMDILFAPRFLNAEHNRAIMDMARNVNNRNIEVNDYFVRVTVLRQPVTGLIHGNATLGDAVDVSIDLVGTNTNTRNIRTWDANMATRAAQVIDNRVTDPIIRQNVLNLIERGEHLGERAEYVMLDFVTDIENAVKAELNRIVTRDIPFIANNTGIIATQVIPVTLLDAAMHVVTTNNPPNTSVSAFSQMRSGNTVVWQPLPVTQHVNGHALVAQTTGTFVFTGHVVNIPGIENVAGGNAITAMVARFGLADILGTGEIDLHENATRHMVVGSIARLAGAPREADPITWVSANMNVTLANRNAQGLVAQQEAIALVMALYERRTNTRVSSIIIRNHQNTANMTLDSRYAQAVRAAFEIGIVNDRNLQPATPVTIGDLLDLLAALDTRVGL
jgi:hypothetical protein